MGDKVTLNLDNSQTEALQQMERDGIEDNISAAGRTALNAGLVELGYLNGGAPRTALRQTVQTVGSAFFVAAMVWLGLTFFYPLEWRAITIAMLVAGFFCYGLDRLVLRRYEPHVSRRLRVWGGA